MRKPILPLLLATLTLTACAGLTLDQRQAVASPTSSSVELVQSVPLETDLAVPGLRQAQEVWLEMIASARSTLDLEQFYVSDQPGESLEPVLKAIQDAAARGVRVRLLADKKMLATYPDSVVKLGGLANSEARSIEFPGGIQHAKVFVIDGHLSFVGSQNFDWRALSHIHELGLRVDDAQIASDIERIFERDWGTGDLVAKGPAQSASAAKAAPSRPDDASTGLTLVASPAQDNPSGIQDSASAIVALLKTARRSIQVQTMEYSTAVGGASGAASSHWRVLDEALRQAAAAGVHVQLMLDVGHVKSAKADLLGLASLKGVEVRAVTIPQWSGGPIDYARLIHSKYVVIDGGTSGWVGTENWSQGYFMTSRDEGFVVNDATIAGQMEQVYSRLWNSSYSAPVK